MPEQTRPEERSGLAVTRVGSFVVRALFVLSGVGLMIGFFMPWVTVGEVMSLSGFGLLFADGQLVGLISGAGRFLLVVIPAFALVLVGVGAAGHKAAPWAAFAGAVVILGYGLFTLVRLFIATTGVGMWLVIASALLALGLGAFGIGRRQG